MNKFVATEIAKNFGGFVLRIRSHWGSRDGNVPPMFKRAGSRNGFNVHHWRGWVAAKTSLPCVAQPMGVTRAMLVGRDKRIATVGGVWYVGAAIAAEGWLSGLKRRFAKPLYGIKACTEGSNPSPSAKLFAISPLRGR